MLTVWAMAELYSLSEFMQPPVSFVDSEEDELLNDDSYRMQDDDDALHFADEQYSTYWYEGQCPQTGQWVRLPRTRFAEAIARSLMHQLIEMPGLAQDGKMFGVLLVESPDGQRGVLKAFSGLLNGQNVVPGWVPPIPGREQVVIEESRTLAQLEAIKQRLIDQHNLPERREYEHLVQQFEQQWYELSDRHRQRKHLRHQQRQQLHAQFVNQKLTEEKLIRAITALDDESRMDGIERRNVKRRREAVLNPLRQKLDECDRQIRQLKEQRRHLSQTLQTQMHRVYRLTNFRGTSSDLSSLMPDGTMPTGTGDCCAPKLLHYAATHHLKPLSMAEFWWGAPSQRGDKIQGNFYGACAERCQPLMGFLLSGLVDSGSVTHAHFVNLPTSVPRIGPLYEDEWLIAVNKPSGLLSVPGRYQQTHDSVLSRLRLQQPEGTYLAAIHRLDQDTSGILLFAKEPNVLVDISQQFQQRQVKKIYVAHLDGYLGCEQGVIDVPLGSHPSDRPRQRVDVENGKPSLTTFQVIAYERNHTRVQFRPLTGRTHQLRVHAADPKGLGIPIVGDCLYGSGSKGDRLHLHASELMIVHPILNQDLHLKTETPF